jgi:hypothetical protein
MTDSLAPTIDLAAAVNNREVLRNCLQRSPDVASGALSLRTYENYPTAAAAYNAALDDTMADVLVLAHQDVYLPKDFLLGARHQLAELAHVDPNWAVAGVAGLNAERVFQGRTWSSGLGAMLGEKPQAPVHIETLDEMLLFVRTASRLRFDEAMPSFHLYAADIVKTAQSLGLRSYVIDTPAIHHSRAVVALDGGYRSAYRYMQRKWRKELPIPNLVCDITRGPFSLLLKDFRLRHKHRGQVRPVEPSDDPSRIARSLDFE